MKIFKKFTLILTLILFTLTLSACGPKPDETVKNFFEAAKKSDFNAMATYMQKDGNKDEFKFDDANQEKIIKAVFSKISYESVSSTVNGTNATVKAKVTSLDLPKIYAKTVGDLMPSLVASAFSATGDDAKMKADIENQVMQTFLNAMNDPNAAKTTTEVDIKLVKGDKGWLIEPTDDLLNALTGNLAKAFKDTNK